MIEPIERILKSYSTEEGRSGIVAALLFVLAITALLGTFSEVNMQTLSNNEKGEYWLSPQNISPALSFPNTNDPQYTVYLLSLSDAGNYVNLSIKERNGAEYSGRFFTGDIIPIHEWRIRVSDIQLDREKPVLISYYKIWNLSGALGILFFLVILKMLWDNFKPKEQKKEIKISKPSDIH